MEKAYTEFQTLNDSTMTSSSSTRLGLSFAALTIAAGLLLPAEAFARSRSRSVTGPQGAARERTIERTPGHLERTTTRTQRDGDTSTRERSRTLDRANGTMTTSTSATHASGAQWQANAEHSRSEGQRTSQIEVTGPGGTTRAAEVVVTRDGNGPTRTVTPSPSTPTP